MSTLTKEWLQKTIAELEEERDAVPGVVNEDAAMALAAMKLALASLEAEPAGYHVIKECGAVGCTVATLKEAEETRDFWNKNWTIKPYFYTAPPAQVSVPDELTREEYKRRFMEEDNFDDTFRGGWNACRAAMLQGSEPVTTAYKLPEGWVAVPVEPTEDMIVNGFESEPDESFSDEKEWEAYEAMSGCQQAAHRAKLCWAAMIKAAPKQQCN